MAPDILPQRFFVFSDENTKDKKVLDVSQSWIAEGILVNYNSSEIGDPIGSVPIYGIIQQNKNKVRPIFDFRSLNEYIDVYSGSSDICVETLRKLRCKSANFAMLDLSQAFLQIRVDKSMWKYQTCIINGKRFALTRMGFGLNTAPIIMKEIVNAVLEKNVDIRKETESYIDDIFVDELIVKAETVVKMHVESYGLLCKPPQRISEGEKVRALGIDVFCKNSELKWQRANAIRNRDKQTKLTRKDVYSIFGQLTGI